MAATLARGSSGPEVLALQQRLNERGATPPLVIDGVFGGRTEAAVIAFQKAHNLVPDGVVGPRTLAALDLAHVPATQNGDDARILRAMELLVEVHGFPVNGAAGIVGNLRAESGVIPNRIEGSSSATPMRARNFAGQVVDFSPDDVMNRNPNTRLGPRWPGIGLAQWTSAARRAGLFQHVFAGVQLGANILFNMEGQVDYLAHELQNNFRTVDGTLRQPGVSADDASDEVAYRFEVPGVALDGHGGLLPRDNPRVQGLFGARRALAQQVLQIFHSAHP